MSPNFHLNVPLSRKYWLFFNWMALNESAYTNRVALALVSFEIDLNTVDVLPLLTLLKHKTP